MSERMFEALAAEAAKRTTVAPGDVIEVGTMSGATTRTMVHSVESHPNGHADWVRLIVGGGAVLLLKRAEVRIVKRFDDHGAEGGE